MLLCGKEPSSVNIERKRYSCLPGTPQFVIVTRKSRSDDSTDRGCTAQTCWSALANVRVRQSTVKTPCPNHTNADLESAEPVEKILRLRASTESHSEPVQNRGFFGPGLCPLFVGRTSNVHEMVGPKVEELSASLRSSLQRLPLVQPRAHHLRSQRAEPPPAR